MAAEVAAAAAATLRRWNGVVRPRKVPLPEKPKLTLYEFEASPYCRRVRETINILGLEVLVKPCPRETLRTEGAYSSKSRHKPEVRAAGGKLLFPFLVDHSANVALNESSYIVEHLWKHYGIGVEQPSSDRVLNGGLPALLDIPLLTAPSALRPWPHAGLMMAPSVRPELPLIMHGCEPDPGCRLVRELLCILQIPYHFKPRDLDSPLPHLEDPNTDFKTFGARSAQEYLRDKYQLGPPLPLTAPVPEPNLGDSGRTSPISWFLPR
uniref:GST N-terminal domain-containing protein n=1 Tax=Chrysotila carterae TaxID=13221 RepID=A0A6S9X0S1_CHRCT